MTQKAPFPFDPEQMMEFFRQNDFTKTFAEIKMPDMDTDALFAAQRKNMEALAEANRAAAAGYQDLFKKQLAIFEETVAEAQKHMKSMDVKADGQAAGQQAELAQAAFEKAIGNMKELADTAQKANTEAYEIVSKRVRDSIDELNTMAEQMRK